MIISICPRQRNRRVDSCTLCLPKSETWGEGRKSSLKKKSLSFHVILIAMQVWALLLVSEVEEGQRWSLLGLSELKEQSTEELGSFSRHVHKF